MDSRRLAGSAGLDPMDVLSRPARPPDLVLRYGKHPDQVGDVHLPASTAGSRAQASAAPILAIFLHGGFWRAAYGRRHTAPLAEALSAAGFVVCAPEYRRTGQRGGGWPGTFDDVAAAVDQLPGLVSEATGGLADPDRLLLAGHSAGGHLALWAASRHRLPPGTPWRAVGPTATGVVALGAVSDLAMCYEQRLGRQAAGKLMGGGPQRYPERYAAGDPAQLLPTGVSVRLVHGANDDVVPCEMSRRYARRADDAGDEAVCTVLPGSGHFEVIDPLSSAWPEVLRAFRLLAPASRPGTGSG